MKVLNLYAGVGGNRKLWENVEVTAVELDELTAGLYRKHFPQDQLIVGDAHQYLLDHMDEYDFIWSSPPCPTHSIVNHFLNAQGIRRYPDMALFQEIIYLKTFCKAKYCVENVKSYYPPLIKPQEAGRHYFWTNFPISDLVGEDFQIGRMNGKNQHRARAQRIQIEGFEVKGEKYLNNCVNPRLGAHILDCAFKIKQEVLSC